MLVAWVWQVMGSWLARPTANNVANMVCLELEDERVDKEAFWRVASERGIMVLTKEKFRGRLVVHYQICEEAVLGMAEMMKAALSKGYGFAKKVDR